MSEGSTKENIPRLTITSDDAGIISTQESIPWPEEIRKNGDNIGIPHDNSLVKAHMAAGDQTFAPVQRVPVEILAEIFVQCIPPLVNQERDIFPPLGYGGELQQARSSLGQVCLTWNIILNEEPRAWATLSLDGLHPTTEIVSAWIKKSKSHPLDVYISRNYQRQDDREAILKLLHKKFWRIRVLIGDFSKTISDTWPVWALFPVDVPTVAPMMEKLTLVHPSPDSSSSDLGMIHCPQIRTLTLWIPDDSIKSFTANPMLNAECLSVACSPGSIIWHFVLLEALPNLDALSWNLADETNDTEFPDEPVVLQHLKTLVVSSCHNHSATLSLRYLNIPSIENLEFAHFSESESDIDRLNEALDTICEKGTVRLRHLTLQNTTPMVENVYPVLSHLMYLETLKLTRQDRPVDALLIALSPYNRDFSSACPKLNMVELSSVNISAGVLVEFVERRVQSDFEEPAPGLVTCLKLIGIHGFDKEPCSRLAETHSWSMHLLPDEYNNSLVWSERGVI